ncbi:MAG: 16S rRNA processing protein RimM [Chloroflexi bacterium]|nr:MAG: 16S rRNA processing protein RimM [Chloroflexota bacterium]
MDNVTEKAIPQAGGRKRLSPRYLAVGKVVRAHGLQGELSVSVLTEFPERFETTEWVYLGDQFEAVPFKVEGYRWHKQHILLTLEGVTSRAQAEQFRGQYVQVPIEEAMPLPEGTQYLYQLMGLAVVTADAQMLGTVVDIIETAANDVLVVHNGERELLLPDIPDVVKTVDLEQGQIVVTLLDGLI